MTSERISVVLPVYDERENIQPCLRGLWKALRGYEHEILVCYDFDADSTLPAIAAMPDQPPTVRLVKNDLGRGAANALRAGFAAATGDVVVTTMADLSDPPEVIPVMAAKLRAEHVAVVSGSRYMQGGSQTGGPLFKRLCSQTASLSLRWLTGIGTHDATSNFRAYSREFLARTPVESQAGFEIALELTVKAHLSGAGVAEVPSSWTDRTAGESRFRMWKWAPNYLRWYWEALAAPLFVLAVFAAMLAAAFTFVARYSSTLPVRDDLEWASVVAPGSPTPLEWWWSCFNEHRIPLPRVIFLALVRTTQDIRSGMYFDVVVLGGVALAMILVARRLRGRTSTTDAFFPLLWLTWGNAENLLMMHQLSLVVPTAITCALLCAFALSPRPPSWRRSLALGLCLFSLPLCGAPGLTPAPALALWFLYAAWCLRQDGTPGASASRRILAGSAIATFLLIGFYFLDFPAEIGATYNKDPLDVLRQAWMFVALGFGPAAEAWWPLSGLVVALLAGTALVVLVSVFRRRASERLRVAGYLAVAAGILAMAVSTGIARGGTHERAAFALRYVTLPSPFLCVVYLALCTYGPAAVGRSVRVLLCALLMVFVYFHVQVGIRYGEQRLTVTGNLCNDLAAGHTIDEVAALHWQDFYGNPADFAERLRTLQAANFGPLAGAREGTPSEPYPMLAVQPILIDSSRVGPRKVGDESVLLVPPECELHFALPVDRRFVTGRFGAYPLGFAFTPADGVRYSVELLQVLEPPRLLFERVLRPQAVEADRGSQDFRIAIPPGAQGEIVLRTSFAGPSRDERAFGYWTAVDIR